MPELWMPGAQRLDIGDHAPTDGGPPKAIGHITWDVNATAKAPKDLVPYERLRSYFSGGGKSAAPHVLWDPFTGRIVQFLPANSRSKSLADEAGGTRTNRAGKVVLQVEALFFPHCRVDGKAYARLTDTPCEGWAELNAWVRSWGVPDTWPMGRPVDFTSRRSESVWREQAGWYAHAHVPENDHQDPGSWPAFVGAPPSEPGTGRPVVDLSELLKAAKTDPPKKGTPVSYPDVRVVEDALVKEGLLAKSLADGHFGTATQAAYGLWQMRCGWSGKAADGLPGVASLTKLGKRRGFDVKE
ncbi:endolysin [Streptomyces phaeolivaceus]|uniref:Endolysin n=1 Tax=Streptomyces phaeolivaceus TaxID=2653200 RepID=A0A5P8K4A7_9ACTN|nr:endolysin [Streptomyces phaeolivaceus]QFQ97467.1 endolysin [Streptomyces phaeolivaceus]